jgi:DNA-binding NarL/FixJ family response regulator
MAMKKRRVLILGPQQLLGEVLEHTLRQVEDLEVDGPWDVDEQVMERLSLDTPDLVIMTSGAASPEDLSWLTAQILDQCPNLAILRVTLDQNQLKIYHSHTLPARSADLLEVIQGLPFHDLGSETK